MADNGDADQAKPATEAGRTRSEQSEWTASDRRGPLGEAEAENGTEPELARAAAANPGPHPQPAAPQPPQAAEPVESQPVQSEPVQSESSAAAPQPAEPQRRHVPVLPIIGALIVGAVIGAGSAAVVYKSGDQGASQSDVNALASRLEALTPRLDALEKRPDPQPEIDQLKASVTNLSAQKPAPAPSFDPAPLQQKIAGLAAEIDALKQHDADHTLGDKVDALGTTVSGLQAQGAQVKDLNAKLAALATSVDGLKQDDASAKAGIASLQSGQKSLEGKTGLPALAVAADSLVAAIDQGRPYTGQVDALAALGADPTRIAVLRENAEKGVPSAQVLAAKFAPLADPITATANHAPPNAGLMDQLKSGMLGMVSVRRSDATSGDDVASRVSRIEVDLAHDDVAGAYQTWSGLPADAKAKSDAWGALAKTQVEAMAAARALQQQAIAALGGRKS